MKNNIILLLFLAIALMALVFYSCDKTSTSSIVSFDTPGIYKGTYKYISDWYGTNQAEYLDSVILDFHGNGHFTMELVNEAIAHFCEIDSADFAFSASANLLIITVIVQNNDRTQICAPGDAPNGQFTYDVQSGYIVFTIQDYTNKIFKQIELKPYIP